jgi:hypothetical protein
VFFCFFWWYWVLNLKLELASALPCSNPFFGFCFNRVLGLLFQDQSWTMILLPLPLCIWNNKHVPPYLACLLFCLSRLVLYLDLSDLCLLNSWDYRCGCDSLCLAIFGAFFLCVCVFFCFFETVFLCISGWP